MNPEGTLASPSPGSLARLGALFLAPLRVVGALALLFRRAAAGALAPSWPRGEVFRQAHSAGNRTVLLVAVTLAFVGMVLVFHAGIQAQRIVGDLSLVGPAYLQLLIREFGPTIAALMVAARVGAGISAEIGSMVVTEQVDALRMNGADPVRYLVAPRLLAVSVMTVVLVVWGCAVAAVSGAVSARIFFDVSYATFLDLRLLHLGDLVTGLMKAVAYGLYVPLAAAWAGLSARGGSEGVGRATTAGVVTGSLGVIVLSVLIGAFAFAAGL
jgi:phospholipid/cholesterol/gamma-HCH transport system permease protein